MHVVNLLRGIAAMSENDIFYFKNTSLTNGVMPKILGVCFVCISILTIFVVWPVLFLTYLSTGSLPPDWFLYLVSPPLLLFFAGIILNVFPDIGVSEKGLHVRFFLVKWLFIPWHEVIGLAIAPITASSKTSVYVIQVRKLTIWHRILGFLVGSGTGSGIAFPSNIDGFKQLTEELESHLEPGRVDFVH